LRYYGCGYPYYCGRPYYYYSVPYYQYYYPHPRYYYYEYYRTYDYPPRTYRQRRPRPPQDSRTGEPDKTASPQTQTEDAGEYVEADPRLEDIADAFAARDYENAARQANQALTDEPENAVLPFVYSQALFADGKYSQAADVLREAVRNLDAEKQELFYPLGFYPDEDILNDQITGLREAAAAQPSNADLQLLLGYQLLGVARYDDALDALHEAQADYVNKEAAAVMIEILERARSTSPDT
jgi:thioredoxin-like negative regulator of GroEL